jgi:hypothetical protein
LLAVIELQNAIAAAGMNADEVMALVVDRAASLTGATGALVAISEGDEVAVRAAARTSGAASGAAPPARLPKTGATARCIA